MLGSPGCRGEGVSGIADNTVVSDSIACMDEDTNNAEVILLRVVGIECVDSEGDNVLKSSWGAPSGEYGCHTGHGRSESGRYPLKIGRAHV